MSRAQRVTRNFAILSLARITSQVLAVVVTLYLTRALMADAFGTMVFAMGLLSWAALIADFGLTSLGQREVARHQLPVDRLARNVIAIQIVFSVLAYGALALFVAVANLSPIARTLTLLYGLSLPITAFDLRWVYFGQERMNLVAVAEVATQATLTLGALFFVRQPEHLIVLPLIYIVAQFIAMLFLLQRYTAQHGFPFPQFDRELIRHLLLDAVPLCGSSLVGMVTFNFSVLILGLVVGLQETGYYGAAQRIVMVPSLLIAAYYLTLRPSLSRAYTDGLSTIDGLLRRSVRLTMAMAIGMVIGGVILGQQFILFLFGAGYAHSVLPFKLLVVATGLIFVNRLFRGILISFNHQATEFKMMLAAALTNIILALLLVGPYGLGGVAFATCAAEAVILGAGFVYTKFLVGKIPFGRFLGRPLLAGVAMAAVLLLTPEFHVLVRIPLGGLVYVALLMWMQVIHRDDINTVINSLVPRRAGLSGAPTS